MGESKRRKKLDKNYGKPNNPLNPLNLPVSTGEIRDVKALFYIVCTNPDKRIARKTIILCPDWKLDVHKAYLDKHGVEYEIFDIAERCWDD